MNFPVGSLVSWKTRERPASRPVGDSRGQTPTTVTERFHNGFANREATLFWRGLCLSSFDTTIDHRAVIELVEVVPIRGERAAQFQGLSGQLCFRTSRDLTLSATQRLGQCVL